MAHEELNLEVREYTCDQSDKKWFASNYAFTYNIGVVCWKSFKQIQLKFLQLNLNKLLLKKWQRKAFGSTRFIKELGLVLTILSPLSCIMTIMEIGLITNP